MCRRYSFAGNSEKPMDTEVFRGPKPKEVSFWFADNKVDI